MPYRIFHNEIFRSFLFIGFKIYKKIIVNVFLEKYLMLAFRYNLVTIVIGQNYDVEEL